MTQYCKNLNGLPDCDSSTIGEFDNGICDDCWEIKDKLKQIRKAIKDENISMGEIAELQSLTKYIDKGDTLLLEWAGVEEHEEETADCMNCDKNHPVEDIEYHGDQVYSCPSCRE